MFSHPWYSVKSLLYAKCKSGALEPRRVSGRRGPGAGLPSLHALVVDHPSPRECVEGRASRHIITEPGRVSFRAPACHSVCGLPERLAPFHRLFFSCLLNQENDRRVFGTPSYLGVPFSPFLSMLISFFLFFFLFFSFFSISKGSLVVWVVLILFCCCPTATLLPSCPGFHLRRVRHITSICARKEQYRVCSFFETVLFLPGIVVDTLREYQKRQEGKVLYSGEKILQFKASHTQET
jgi:hypothetical protein